jgi:predicted phosphodiesterase
MRWSFILLLAACSAAPDTNHHDGVDAAGTGDAPASGDAATSTIDDLRFAIVGDTRPANIDDTTYYPTAIVDKIWQDIAAETPPPKFAVGTGDYMFASTYRNEQAVQLDKYMTARATFSGPMYAAMGNHECTGATASNCGTGATDGVTKNMTTFMTTMLGPLGVTTPYYTEHVDAADGSWTAKVVVVACNAWSATQASWLTAELATPTTYTFVVRHEGTSAMSQTPCSASQTIIDAHPLTLLIVGHTHTYAHYAYDKEIIVGNGGAPLTSGNNYGYVIVARNANGTLTVTAYDYMTHAVLDTFTIGATGAAA